jgi:hypothetical protein
LVNQTFIYFRIEIALSVLDGVVQDNCAAEMTLSRFSWPSRVLDNASAEHVLSKSGHSRTRRVEQGWTKFFRLLDKEQTFSPLSPQCLPFIGDSCSKKHAMNTDSDNGKTQSETPNNTDELRDRARLTAFFMTNSAIEGACGCEIPMSMLKLASNGPAARSIGYTFWVHFLQCRKTVCCSVEKLGTLFAVSKNSLFRYEIRIIAKQITLLIKPPESWKFC